ncbi:unnamed protein product [Merluccius merluccius]
MEAFTQSVGIFQVGSWLQQWAERTDPEAGDEKGLMGMAPLQVKKRRMLGGGGPQHPAGRRGGADEVRVVRHLPQEGESTQLFLSPSVFPPERLERL